MNPLNSILDWFDGQTNDEVKLELVLLSESFHIENGIELESDYNTKIGLFRNFLTSVNERKKQEIQKVLFLKSLINFAIEGRDTEEGWNLSLERNKLANERIKKEGFDSNTFDKFKLTFEYRKNMWIAWSNEWKALQNASLSNDKLWAWSVLNG